MSVYNMLFGENDKADVLLACLGLNRDDFGRYRDCYLTKDYIVVHTRCGGGNREDYEWVFENASDHPCYVKDEDDNFDCTYADIYFKYPEDYAKELTILCECGQDIAPSEKGQMLLDNLMKKSEIK